jgi:octaprenyl-diphosphate synthase
VTSSSETVDGPDAVPSDIGLTELFAPVQVELDQVQRELVRDLAPGEPDLEPLVDLAVSFRGKQLRPAMVCLSGLAVGSIGPAHVHVGKVVELLHTATLVHDDVLDGARLRRRQTTVNAAYGTEVPVLLGDYIYARAFHMAVSMDDPTCSRVLSEAVRQICQGEITQILHRFDFDWDEPRYFRVIADKTACLYAVSCQLGAYHAGGTPEQCAALHTYGMEIGIAFQIIDDCLDLGGDESVVGKSLGTDLSKGKLTLPLLWLMREPTRRTALQELMQTGASEPELLVALRRDFPLEEALAYSSVVARQRVEVARRALDGFAPSPAVDSLDRIAGYVLERSL